MLFDDNRIKDMCQVEDPRRGDLMARLCRMRDEYEAHIAELEAQLASCKEQVKLRY